MSTKDIVYIALFAALTAVLGLFPPVTLPVLPAPITAQSLGVMLAGSVLGARRGGLAIVLFLALVAVGLPLLPGGRGGLGVFFGPTGGFLLSWPIAAFVVGYLFERSWNRVNLLTAILFNILGGILVIYAIGIPWLAAVANLPLMKAVIGSAIYIPGDLVKVTLAGLVAVTVKRSYPLIAARA